MTEDQTKQGLVELKEEEFKEKYTAFVESQSWGDKYPGISESRRKEFLWRKEAFLANGIGLRRVIMDILSPMGLAGKRVTLLSGDLSDCPEYLHTIEDVVKSSGGELKKFESPYYESVWIKESFTRDENLDKQRWASINESDYLFCRAGTVCNVAFFPIVHQYVRGGKGKALFFLDEYRLTEQCRDDWELKALRDLKKEGKEIHIITKSKYADRAIHRFL